MNYTNEQKQYIDYDGPKDTKLLACAGSGKTRCIIARMDRLIKENIYKPDNVLMLTFSRFTRDDFMQKLKTYGAKYIKKSSVRTIDSFAKSLIDKDNTVDVSLLSLKFMKYLENTKPSVLRKNEKLACIKMVFVDEAQDLNEIQYHIFKNLKRKLKVNVNLIGDPNQNIFQFRGSSDKYLRSFRAKVFTLTKNFRSYAPIVEFSKYLRPFNDMNIECTKGDLQLKPVLTFYDNEKTLEKNLVALLKGAMKKGIEMSDFAILSPTRGRMKGYGRSHGLCLISNVLFKSGIKFKQFYEEATDESFGGGITYEPVKGHVNVLTYMGSKGLEWKYVIIIDADMCLINKRYFDEDKHNADRYLLYVACSRAIENMIIFSKCQQRQGIMEFKTNPWFDLVPKDIYDVDRFYVGNFYFPKLKYIDMGDRERRVTRIINRMDEYTLEKLSDLISYETRKERVFKEFYDRDYSEIDETESIFLGKFTEALFHAFCNIKYKRKHKASADIENIIDSVTNPSIIMDKVPHNVTEWFYANRKGLTWNKFDNDDSIEKYVKDYINKNFDRNKELHLHTIINDDYFKALVLEKRKWVKTNYEEYMDCEDYKEVIEPLFNVVVILYSFETQHWFHIRTDGKRFYHILNAYADMFDEMIEFVKGMKYKFIDNNSMLSKWGIVGEIDIFDEDDGIWEIKCTNSISLKHFLQVVIYNIMYHELNVKRYPVCKVRFINLLCGEITHYNIRLSKKKVNEIITIFQKTGNIFNEMQEDYKEENKLDMVINRSTEIVKKTE